MEIGRRRQGRHAGQRRVRIGDAFDQHQNRRQRIAGHIAPTPCATIEALISLDFIYLYTIHKCYLLSIIFVPLMPFSILPVRTNR